MKPKENPVNSFLHFLKHLGHRYKNTGTPTRIAEIANDCSEMVLEDGSQWKHNATFTEQQIFWGRGETVVVYAGRGGGWGVELYKITNAEDGDAAFWTFHGYVSRA